MREESVVGFIPSNSAAPSEPNTLPPGRSAGLTDSDIVETVANVAVNIFINYINHAAEQPSIFPEVKPSNTPLDTTCVCA